MHLSRQGDRDAFAKFFELRREQLSREVRRKIRGRLRQRVDASDVLQDVFLLANRRLDEVTNTEIPLLAWIRVLLNQRVVELMRSHLATSKRSLLKERSLDQDVSGIDALAEQLAAALTSPSMNVQRMELQRRVRELLDAMSAQDRAILQLRHFQGLSNADVAQQLGLSVNAASNRYVRALRRLKGQLDSTN